MTDFQQDTAHLIVISANGFDTQGYPLPAQIYAAMAAADLYHQLVRSGEKVTILATGLGLPNGYTPNEPSDPKRVVRMSEQTSAVLQQLGVPSDHIATGGFATDTIGEGYELLAYVATPVTDESQQSLSNSVMPKIDKFMHSYSGKDPVTYTKNHSSLRQQFQKAAQKKITYVAPRYYVERVALTDDNLLRLAGIDAETKTAPVDIPSEMVMPVNGLRTVSDLLAHQAESNRKYKETYGALASLDEHFNFLCANHGLYSKGHHAPHQNLPLVKEKVADHDARPDKGLRPYKGKSLQDIYPSKD